MSEHEIQITTADSGEPFLFASYKSQNREVVEKILYRLQKHYGLRVYYDKEFMRDTSPWYDLMAKQLSSANCKGLLAFGSEEYVCSYACLMELLYFRTNDATDEYVKPYPIIPISLDSTGSLIANIKPRMELIELKIAIQLSEIKFIREKIIESISDNYGHLSEILSTTEILALLRSIEDVFKSCNTGKTSYPIKPIQARIWISKFFQIMGENTKFYFKKAPGASENAALVSDIEGLCDQLADTIRNPDVCGESVFEPVDNTKPLATAVPAAASTPAPAVVAETPAPSVPPAVAPVPAVVAVPAAAPAPAVVAVPAAAPAPEAPVSDAQSCKRALSSTGDIEFKLYGKSYTENQSGMMLTVFSEVIRRHADAVDALISSLICASATDYTNAQNRGSGMPTYFRICKTLHLAETNKQICIGTAFGYGDKLRQISKLFQLCGETTDVLEGVTLPTLKTRSSIPSYLTPIAPAVPAVAPAPAEISEPAAIPAAPAVTPVIVPTASAPVNQPPVTQAAEISLSRFAGSVRPDMTLADFRTLATDGAFCQVLGQLRRDGTLFPRQRGLFDYAMLSILGGCNAMAFPYQQNYYDWAVANLDRKLESAKRTADWTWSSNARKVVGLEKSGRLDAAFNAPFETISDQTTLAQMQEAFLRNASTEYHTKDNAAVSRVFDILYQQLG